jgi:hypothetical protein
MCLSIHNAFPEIPATSHLPLYTGYNADSFHSSGGFQASSIHRGENLILFSLYVFTIFCMTVYVRLSSIRLNVQLVVNIAVSTNYARIK